MNRRSSVPIQGEGNMMDWLSKRPRDDLPPELKVFLDAAKVIPPLPAEVRARAMKRARASLAAPIGGAVPPPQLRAVPRAAIRARGPRLALAIGVAVLSVITMGAAAALKFGPATHDTRRAPNALAAGSPGASSAT